MSKQKCGDLNLLATSSEIPLLSHLLCSLSLQVTDIRDSCYTDSQLDLLASSTPAKELTGTEKDLSSDKSKILCKFVSFTWNRHKCRHGRNYVHIVIPSNIITGAHKLETMLTSSSLYFRTSCSSSLSKKVEMELSLSILSSFKCRLARQQCSSDTIALIETPSAWDPQDIIIATFSLPFARSPTKKV